jgi:hypothetical protein
MRLSRHKIKLSHVTLLAALAGIIGLLAVGTRLRATEAELAVEVCTPETIGEYCRGYDSCGLEGICNNVGECVTTGCQTGTLCANDGCAGEKFCQMINDRCGCEKGKDTRPLCSELPVKDLALESLDQEAIRNQAVARVAARGLLDLGTKNSSKTMVLVADEVGVIVGEMRGCNGRTNRGK